MRVTNKAAPLLARGPLAGAMAAALLIALGAWTGPASPAAAGAAASARRGLGATPYAGGTTFRVWAPNADRVHVAGDFNAWDREKHELGREAGGVFSVDVAGARAGHAYELVIRRGAKTIQKADPRARRVTHSAGASIVVDPSAYAWSAKTRAWKPPPKSAQVIYEMHIGTFNVTSAGRPGTFASAAARLDALAELGVNMLEVLPPAEFPGDFSWGYNPSFPFAPESAYGTPDDLRAFIDAAHARGMGVLIDVVHNHWGPMDLPMWCFDGESLGSGGIYFYTDSRGKTPWGPRPDYGRKEVREYIADNARMWLEEYRADGMRWDSTCNIRMADEAPIKEGLEMLTRIGVSAHALSPSKLLIAEDFKADASITRPAAAGGMGFDAQWDGGFFHPIDDMILASSDAERHVEAVKGAITNRLGASFDRVIYTESHDEVANGKKRIPETISPGDPASFEARKRSTLGASITLTSPGIPMLFQGQEMLEDGWFDDRRPLDWSKATTHAGIRRLYRDLIALRTNRSGTTRGLTGERVRVTYASERDKVIVYRRSDRGGPGDDVVVVANLGGRPFAAYDVPFPRSGVWRVRFNGDSRSYSPDFKDTPCGDVAVKSASGRVGLGPYCVVILSQ